jgi:hypothetical protein
MRWKLRDQYFKGPVSHTVAVDAVEYTFTPDAKGYFETRGPINLPLGIYARRVSESDRKLTALDKARRLLAPWIRR